ncbi:MAG: hypothetical protein GX625_09755 [Clostridiaceae bacterium]|nr:hypothetical protein [Clostridiaceae bacterium]
MEYKEFTIAATIKIQFDKIIHYKVVVGRTTVIFGNDTLIKAKYIIGNAYAFTLHTIFTGFFIGLFDLGRLDLFLQIQGHCSHSLNNQPLCKIFL